MGIEERVRENNLDNVWKTLTVLLGNNNRMILYITLGSICFSLTLLKSISFDNNTINLQSPDSESVLSYRELSRDSNNSPLFASLLLNDLDTAETTIQKLQTLPTVKDVRWIYSFIPEQQNEKLTLIDDLNLLLGDTFNTQGHLTTSFNDKIRALESLINTIEAAGPQHTGALYTSLIKYQKYIHSKEQSQQQRELEELNTNLTIGLSPLLQNLKKSLNGDVLSLETLPAHFKDRWFNDGYYLIEVYPAHDLNDNTKLTRFVSDIKSVSRNFTGPAVVLVEAGNAVVEAFQQAFFYALIAISVVIVISSGFRKDVLFILAPLIIAALYTAAITVILEIPFNFANIIALPLLLGIGVDSSIHIMHRYLHLPNHHILTSSSAKAITLSAITTVLSIGNLAFSPHQGTASMGLLLSIGILISVICTLIILPALLKAFYRQ